MRAVGRAKPTWDELNQEIEASFGQTLLRCARLVDEAALARVAARGIAVRPAHTRLFPHLGPDGTRLSDLAKKLGVTKQAVGQLVDELASEGLLEVVPDPADGRARLVRVTAAGRDAIRGGLRALADVERDLAARVGAATVARAGKALAELVEALGEMAAARRDAR